jgi:hypothetical protein
MGEIMCLELKWCTKVEILLTKIMFANQFYVRTTVGQHRPVSNGNEIIVKIIDSITGMIITNCKSALKAILYRRDVR